MVGPALAHYHEFRFRCRLCDTIFCSACKTVPYHTGASTTSSSSSSSILPV